jgi:NAD(P)-dependent dehydrogenase (short-subunit alcohol dehydrogenase family)
MDLQLDGKVVIVTGASRGIGLAASEAFVREGARVVMVARKEYTLRAAAEELGPNALAVVGNVGNEGAGERIVAAAHDAFGRVDVIVNNAATNPYFGDLVGIDWPRAQKTVMVNQWGPLALVQAAWNAGWCDAPDRECVGSVVNIASVGAMTTDTGVGWYNMTKAAMVQLTRYLATELGPRVRVNTVAPGMVNTHLSEVFITNHGAEWAARLPMQRIAEPEDIAPAILFLASPVSGWVTGIVMPVDGGHLVVPYF